MRDYELVLVVWPDLGKEEKEKLLSKIKKEIGDVKGTVQKEEDWGKKELAYRIKRFSEASFCFLNILLDPSVVRKFEQKVRLEEKVLRYLLVQSDAVTSTPKSEEKEKETGAEVKSETKKGSKRAKSTKNKNGIKKFK